MRHIAEVFGSRVVVLLPRAGRPARARTRASARSFALDASELAVAQWVYEHGQVAGLGTDTLPGAAALYLPLVGSRGTRGRARASGPRTRAPLHAPEQLHQLETFASQTALALERAQLADEAQQAQVRAETERLRNSLLSSVSHDLRTPLAVDHRRRQQPARDRDAPRRRRPAASCSSRSTRRPTGSIAWSQNLLDMTRLESGALQLHKEWQPLEEVVGAALGAPRQGAGAAARSALASPPTCRSCRSTRADRAGADQPARERAQVHAAGQPDRDRARRPAAARC